MANKTVRHDVLKREHTKCEDSTETDINPYKPGVHFMGHMQTE